MELENFKQLFYEDFKKLFETKEGYDVIIQVGENNESIYAHSIILRARSRYFQTAFSENWAIKKDGYFIFKKPNVSKSAFQSILKYLYTAEINIESYEGTEILEFLAVADELNLNKVTEYITKFLLKNKSIFLRQDPVKILQVVYKHKTLFEFKDFCLEQICESPEALFYSNNFVSLEEQHLLSLIKQDKLNMKEIEIWNHIIRWGIAQDPQLNDNTDNWDSENFTLLEKKLHNLIPFIRFHQISSKDYYQKVKPYKKILPKDLKSDIERCYLVPNARPEINVFKERFLSSLGTIGDSILINNDHLKLFSKWISNNEEKINIITHTFKLIFRGGRNGSSPKEFHQKCDGMGATIIIAKIKGSDQIVGGYNPLDWKMDVMGAEWKTTSESFIFSFKNFKELSSAKLGRVNEKSYAICCDINYGPIFGRFNGNNHDLVHMSTGIWAAGPSSYSDVGIPSSFDTDDYEVFQVIERN
ncbi:7146_t:CDS:2 [Scutellospora calospora]|uniref:7146_t:CDS:1 n=1 Tax=Scutellospora calospora TaxID=85575 RepID=A0ACA9L927_9GLOM|nr:7146_t:CDS:2 [Scutellospora calospora]